MLHKDHDYIACQGPLESTTKDFWDMVLQYRVSKIVMLTKTHEQGRDNPSELEVNFYVS
jgi:protein tyrosine phosphatase